MVRHWLLTLLLAGLISTAPAHEAEHPAKPPAVKPERPQLGTSAAFAKDGTLYAVARQGEHVMLYVSRDRGQHWQAPLAVNTQPEAISADGENRPKLVLLPDGKLVVSWSRRLRKQYTAEIRLTVSSDGGKSFNTPQTVHRDRQEIGHSFETLLADSAGRLYIVWLDKRDATASGPTYRGSAVYAAVSLDGGNSFAHEHKVADHSCECCRITASLDNDGAPVILWRHVFAPNERDHAMAKLASDGQAGPIERATFDHWQVDACPHHGPSLAIAPDGTRHAVWFNVREGAGRVFYGRLGKHGVSGQRTVGGERAAHADIAVNAAQVAIIWKEFDGEKTRLLADLSHDNGEHFTSIPLAATERASDQPRILRHEGRFYAFWRTENEGMRLFELP